MSKYVIASVALAIIVLVAFAAGQNGDKRCGFDDAEFQRVRRYAFLNSPHAKLDLTYQISAYSKNLSRADVDDTLKKAFRIWSDHVDFTFRQIDSDSTEKPDINVRFAVGEHGDGFPFDGPGGVLAHAVKNWLHFDDEETWKFKAEDEGTNLFTVAVHEIGHTLGLGHSSIENSIMFPWYQDVDETKLHEDDVLGIQEVYKIKKDKSKFHLNLCKDAEFDTVFENNDGKILIFKGDVYYELEGQSIVAGPKKISEVWKELPADIDGAYTLDNKTYFFKDGVYWLYEGKKLHRYSPERINGYSHKLPLYVDSVMVGKDNKIYFFKGSKYYRVDKFHHDNMDVETGNIGDEFEGIPDRISAAFYHPTHRRTYFFKNESFYVYDSSSRNHPAYEIPTTSYFFNC